MVEIEEGSLEALQEESRREFEQVQRELKEIDLLIQQTTDEVERLARQNTQATNRLHQVESSFETVPRQDIQEAYTAVLDTQKRLFTMRGQLEKLQSDQRNMTEYLELLRTIIEFEGEVEVPEPEAVEEEQSAEPTVVRIIEAQERERRRLSRQMHDGPAQSLTNLILQAEICERLMDKDPEQARTELANLKHAVTGTFQKVKEFILNLRPMMLDDLGLVPTLRRYMESLSETTDIQANLTVTGGERRLVSHEEVTIFRVIQDLLNNAQEYSHAGNVQVNLDLGEDLIRVSVEDDGEGFDITEALNSSEAEQLGLKTIRERIEMLGGEVHFESSLGQGMKANLELPALEREG